MKYRLNWLSLIVLISNCYQSHTKAIQYPDTRKDENVIDTYFGTEVADPYRWLEDDNSDETARWIEAQNKLTFAYLENIPQRNAIKKRLTEIWDYEKVSTPFKRGEKYYFYKNEGLQNQSVLYSSDEIGGEEKVILDPNTFSEDGTVALSGTYFNHGGNLLGYAKSIGGSDWKEFYIKDLSTGDDRKDHLQWIKFSGMAWVGDGFYYSRYPKPQHRFYGRRQFRPTYSPKISPYCAHCSNS